MLVDDPVDFNSEGTEFSRWETPFEHAKVWVRDVVYDEGALSFRVKVWLSETGASLDPELAYSVTFAEVSAFRVLDEGGLPDFWTQAPDGGQRATSFRVRNHRWAMESSLSFFHGTDEGWSYVISTDAECIEVLSRNAPVIA